MIRARLFGSAALLFSLAVVLHVGLVGRAFADDSIGISALYELRHSKRLMLTGKCELVRVGKEGDLRILPMTKKISRLKKRVKRFKVMARVEHDRATKKGLKKRAKRSRALLNEILTCKPQDDGDDQSDSDDDSSSDDQGNGDDDGSGSGDDRGNPSDDDSSGGDDDHSEDDGSEDDDSDTPPENGGKGKKKNPEFV